jgi:hypothetical protein
MSAAACGIVTDSGRRRRPIGAGAASMPMRHAAATLCALPEQVKLDKKTISAARASLTAAYFGRVASWESIAKRPDFSRQGQGTSRRRVP